MLTIQHLLPEYAEVFQLLMATCYERLTRTLRLLAGCGWLACSL